MSAGGRDALTVGLLGRIPPALGGAGLERQMALTAAALERAGHRTVQVDCAERSAGFDLLHAFGTEPAVWHQLRHWTRNRAPLVISPVVVLSPGREELALRLSARLPGVVTSARMRAELVRRADALVAVTAYERRLLTRCLGADEGRVTIVGNGADPIAPGDVPRGVPGEYVLTVGAVTPRKRQLEVMRALAGHVAVVVVGEYAGEPGGRPAWEAAVADTGAVWLGHVDDPAELAALRGRALAVAHLSEAEGQSLAVMEALAQGAPLLLSDIPSHRELAVAHPGHVRVVGSPGELPGAVDSLRREPRPEPPRVPTWDDVARGLTAVYRTVLSA